MDNFTKKIKIVFFFLLPLLFLSSLPAIATEEEIAETVPVATVKEERSLKQEATREASKNKRQLARMEKNWDAIFSKKLTPDSRTYIVESGDSLYVIAKRNHTTVDLIKKINGLKGDTIYPDMKLKLFAGTFSIDISKTKNTLTLFADGKPIKRYHVSTGKDGSTPAGTFKIVNKLVDPTWFKTGAIYPPGSPDNALGTRWLGFDLDEYGIHGTIEPEKIGQSISLGCIRMLNENVEELYSIVPVGTEVTITNR